MILFDSLSDYFYFKEGTLPNREKGIEGTQGYYCISKKHAENFYKKMSKKDKSLPLQVIEFQEAKETVEKILKNY